MNDKARILLVDDERDFKRAIIPSGTIVQVCRTSAAAIDLLNEAARSRTPFEQI